MLPAPSANSASIRAGVGQVAPDLLEQMRAVTGLDAAEICRRHPEDLVNAWVAQPIMYLLSYAYGRELERLGVRPQALAGHSLGQYAALTLAGSFDFATGLELVQARIEAIWGADVPEQAQMLKIVGLSADQVAEICDPVEAWPAAVNGPTEVIVRGDEVGLAAIAPSLRAAGAQWVILLMGTGGLHTPMMSAAADQLHAFLATKEISTPRMPVASSTSGRFEDDPRRWRELLAHELDRAVRWDRCMYALPGSIPLLEVGAGSGLVEMAKQCFPERMAIVVDSLVAVDRTVGELAQPALA
jgi:[acyl-carrier-protein] S-malonyltransferase